ncbi:MAG: hypothetical protein OHK93_001541 [Ramalina farinacea]|uniref:Cryptic loci regulator 2 N-terminal domain-containing protein n=1 Tax=Ramalina farinacea TaxID=258253 RepID=A0AA43QPN0_9LECA|nr:hypothetical protein [Ramalina farinacea]
MATMSTSAITFPVSDGDPSHRPPPNSRHVIATREAQANYRAKVGKAIAKSLEGYRPGMEYILKNLPEGYTFYERPRPPGKGTQMVRIDRFLFGHPSHYIFMSSCEFTPHARWLATNGRGTCSCFGCNGGRTKSTKRKRSRPAAPTPTATKTDTSRPVVLIKDSPPSPSPKREARTDEHSEAAEPQEGSILTKLFTDLKTEGNLDLPITRFKQDRNFNPSPTIIWSQGAFVPRRGELVLYLSSAPLSNQPSNPDSPHQTRSANAQPVWKSGFVTQLPHYLLPPLELSDITEPNPRSSNVGNHLAGFRVQTMSDSKSFHSDQELPMEYLPLKSLRPFCFHEEILNASNTTRREWHPSIFNALRASASFSLALPARFTGTWPDAQIFYDALFFGAELILVGDVIRVAMPLQSAGDQDQQSQSDDFKINACKVTSIVLTFEGLAPDADQKPYGYDGSDLILGQPPLGSRNADTGVASFAEEAPSRNQDVATAKQPPAVHTRQSARGRPRKDASREPRVHFLRENLNDDDEVSPNEPDPAPSNLVTGENCKRIRLRLHGKFFTRSPILPDRNTGSDNDEDVVIAVNNTHIPPVLQSSDAHWVPLDSPYKIHSIPLSHVLGRFHEDEAVMRYGITPQPQTVQTETIAGEDATIAGEEEDPSDTLSLLQPSLHHQQHPLVIPPVDLGVDGIQRAREYARNHHEWIVKGRESGRSRSKKLWFWGNDRVEGLFGNGDQKDEDVGKELVDGWVREERGDDAGGARLYPELVGGEEGEEVMDLDS